MVNDIPKGNYVKTNDGTRRYLLRHLISGKFLEYKTNDMILRPFEKFPIDGLLDHSPHVLLASEAKKIDQKKSPLTRYSAVKLLYPRIVNNKIPKNEDAEAIYLTMIKGRRYKKRTDVSHVPEFET